MKKHYLFLLLAFGMAQAQVINFPDPAFKSLLLQASPSSMIALNSLDQPITIDVNGDGQIDISEAQVVKTLLLYEPGPVVINSLVGIKSFTNLEHLSVAGMSILASIDVSNMSSLKILQVLLYNLSSINVSGAGLTYLDIGSSQITTLDVSSLTLLQTLRCTNNQLTNLLLPSGASVLSSLDCSGNNLSVLNVAGQNGLHYITCTNNQLSSLNLSGLPNLEGLICKGNSMTSLVLPTSGTFKYLDCSDNLFTSMSLPSSVTNLDCGGNLFSSFDFVPVSTKVLTCGGSLNTAISISNKPQLISLSILNSTLVSLSLSGVPQLKALYCSNKPNLTHLDLSAIVAPLSNADSEIYVDHNQLTELIMPSSVTIGKFDCSYNSLHSLAVNSYVAQMICNNNPLQSLSLTKGVNVLRAENCQLTSLTFGEADYNNIYCYNNQLETIDLRSNTDQYSPYLDCHNNNLKSIMSKKKLNTSTDISGNPNLEYLCVHNTQVAAFKQKVTQLGYSAEVNAYCSYEPGAFYHIEGTQHVDADNNGCTEADITIPHLTYSITNGTVSGSFISDRYGNYDIAVQAGTHTVSPVFATPYFTSTPTSAAVNFPDAGLTASPSFCISKTGVYHDVRTCVMPLGVAVPGFDAKYRLTVSNEGTESETTTLTFAYDEATLDFVSANPAPTSQAPGLLSWTVNLDVFQRKAFLITMNLNSPAETPPLDLNDLLVFTSSAPLNSDTTPDNNSFMLHEFTRNALDPNDKTCLEGNTIGPDMAGKYLHYLIRFENTGNYPAQIVTVEDMIDTAKFDISTIEPLDGSHAFTTRITGNKVEFIFNNIMLPFDDANNDGWVLFRIKTKPTLVLGDSVSNTAGIYFNFNPPVITNTATTTFATMGVDSHFDTSFTLWPNPANDVVNMESKRGEAITSVSIFNTLGQELLRENGTNLRNVNVSGLAAGTYVITVATDKSKSSTQLIKK
ncbi:MULTISPECIES: T9SS type A sorting domain-containing protein [unclassified Flavobacterium]|uniref:DUF7619 domain-containing protein n=1 Tax=unclassified Flavobacterium TaxID=196869 RepID=UPI001F148B16|nr:MULTISPECIES: T9SS type A sorting domain-containing protein [unclassified Flavobacterium]UMY64751.1 T9SS type A sorting domain-containing protein [Flavobacterium sp. HJ-32-4]